MWWILDGAASEILSNKENGGPHRILSYTEALTLLLHSKGRGHEMKGEGGRADVTSLLQHLLQYIHARTRPRCALTSSKHLGEEKLRLCSYGIPGSRFRHSDPDKRGWREEASLFTLWLPVPMARVVSV